MLLAKSILYVLCQIKYAYCIVLYIHVVALDSVSENKLYRRNAWKFYLRFCPGIENLFSHLCPCKIGFQVM